MNCRSSQRGVALVLTLIMLAIITVVTVVFLATARRNRISTTVRSDQIAAEHAAEDAYQRASAEITERILRETNLLAMDFLVSQPGTNLGDVLYSTVTRRPSHTLTPMVTNSGRSIDVYLDLNRNREFDPGVPVAAGNTAITNGYRHGDPVWIGILDKPWLRHAPNNRFIARMAYVVLPTGTSLDLNTIHNDTSPNPGYGFLRNQGFGPWELNLAAFLNELSPVDWTYQYGPVAKPQALGTAFADARSLLNYRHGWPTNPPANPIPSDAKRLAQVFIYAPPNFPPVSIDAYSDGNNGTVLGRDPFLLDDDTPLKPSRWAGADTGTHFFHLQELFDRADFSGRSNKVTSDFYYRLVNAISNNPSVYYRLTAQLGTDSGDELRDRINLNYADEHANIPGTNYSATNFVAWDSSPTLAVAFFTNVAQRIFLAQSNEFNNLSTNQIPIRSITEIPIAPTNMYSTAIHRILQEASTLR